MNDIRGRGKDYSKDRLLLLDGGGIYQGARYYHCDFICAHCGETWKKTWVEKEEVDC